MEQQTIFEICENENEQLNTTENEQQFSQSIPIVTPIETKWETVRIGSIKQVEITNKQYYNEDENNEVIKPSNFNSFVKLEKQIKIEKKGLLKSSNLKISFTISKKASISSPSLLSYRKVDYTLPSNHRSKIDIIYNNQSNNQSEPSNDNEEKVYTIEVPFYSGLEDLKVPLFDEFHFKGENLIHHTIVLDAYDEKNLSIRSNENGETSLRSIPEISYYIRLVIKDFKDVEIVSISTNNVDTNRVGDIFNHSKEFTVLSAITLKNSLFDLFGKCKRNMKKEKKNKDQPPTYSQIEYRLVENDNVNNVDENEGKKVEERSDLYAQFQKYEYNIQNFATPVQLPVQIPPNCQVIYCIAPPIPQHNNQN